MPVKILLNGDERKFFHRTNFNQLKSKYSQIEIMDWKYYIKPVNFKPSD